MNRRTLKMLLCSSAMWCLPTFGLKAKEPNMLPPIPEMVTSLGAAIVDGHVYMYGGHTGRAHHYSNEAQANQLWRLPLNGEKKWKSLGTGPHLQGLAMVAYKGQLYRLGGFTAKNKDDEQHDLWSQANVDRFDPKTGKWSKLPPMPEPRSSFDAAVMDGVLYVVGGWKMTGDGESKWHKTAHALDLSAKQPKWQALPEPPFVRRALSVAAYQGKLYVIGGMQQRGGPTTRVAIYDAAKKKWTQGPSLPGKGMEGFGSSSFATGGRLYASTYSGKLLRLAQDGSKWEVVRELERARFFHRMLPVDNSKLLLIGGASVQEGKFEEVDVVTVK